VRRAGVQVGIEHHHIAAHLHFMGHAAGHPDRPLRRHHPVAQVGKHFQRAGGSVGELTSRVRVPRKHGARGVFAQRHQRVGAVGIKSRHHGPILSKVDLT